MAHLAVQGLIPRIDISAARHEQDIADLAHRTCTGFGTGDVMRKVADLRMRSGRCKRQTRFGHERGIGPIVTGHSDL